MKTEVKELWLAALRSGDYEQTTGALHRRAGRCSDTGDYAPPGYCCLGVLCDLAVKAGVDVDVRSHPDGYTFFDNSSGALPMAVKKWAGLGSRNPHALYTDGEGDKMESDLIELNDSGVGFGRIADAIESSL
jgi:hypothetical protein